MKYILKPILKLIAYTLFYILKIFLLLLAIIIGYIVGIGLSIWNFKVEKMIYKKDDMLWLIKTIWNDVRMD